MIVEDGRAWGRIGDGPYHLWRHQSNMVVVSKCGLERPSLKIIFDGKGGACSDCEAST